MAKIRPYVLSVAGFDPSAGAGVLADIKTFEQCKVMGLGVVSAQTYQTEDAYLGTQWLTYEQILSQLEPLVKRYEIGFVKIGLIENMDILDKLVRYLCENIKKVKIILDPIVKASASNEYFHTEVALQQFESILGKIYMLTPNWDELKFLYKNIDPLETAQHLSQFCNIYVKGGHREEKKGYDTLFQIAPQKVFSFRPKLKDVFEKHGSGCVLSAALTANLAQGFPLIKSCLRAKEYTEYVLKSNPTKLGWHKR